MQRFGIDISHWQENFNFAKAKEEGAEFVIIKAGGGDSGLYKDSKFDRNYEKAKACGMGVGAYFYGNAFSIEAASKEADKFLSILAGKQFEYPVYYDVEKKMLNQDKTKLTDIIIAFCEKLEQAGYFVGVYSSEYTFNHNMEDHRLTKYVHWVAKYAANRPVLASGISIGIWQYGGEINKLRSNKIGGVVCDQDYCYVDYPETIQLLGLNGFKDAKTQSAAETKTEKPMQNSFLVKIETPYLNIRKGPGTDHAATGKYTGRGIFTIVEIQSGEGSKAGWGRLKYDAGWIALDFAKQV